MTGTLFNADGSSREGSDDEVAAFLAASLGLDLATTGWLLNDDDEDER